MALREVWDYNLEEEITSLSRLSERYPLVGLETDFPGVLARPIGTFVTASDYTYQTVRANVDLLKIIRVEISLMDEQGNTPSDSGADIPNTWLFHFKFNTASDLYAQDALTLLTKNNVDFALHARSGIDVFHFGELMITSGLVLNEEVTWVSFQSCYDFGYLLGVLSGDVLPSEESDFSDLLELYFPCLWDVRYVLGQIHGKPGEDLDDASCGLWRTAAAHHVETTDSSAFSMVALKVFFAMRRAPVGKALDASLMGFIHELGTHTRDAAAAATAAATAALNLSEL